MYTNNSSRYREGITDHRFSLFTVNRGISETTFPSICCKQNAEMVTVYFEELPN